MGDGGPVPISVSDGKDDLPAGVPAATEFQRLFGLRQGKNYLNERPELAVVNDLCDLSEPLAVGLDADPRGAHALFPGEVLPRLLRQRHENPAFLEDAE